MATITVNKLDKSNDESEFDIETLDDIQTGGAESSVATLSVPSGNNTSAKLNSLEKVNTTVTNTKSNGPLENKNSLKTEPEAMEESEFPTEDESAPVNKNKEDLKSSNMESTKITSDETMASNTSLKDVSNNESKKESLPSNKPEEPSSSNKPEEPTDENEPVAVDTSTESNKPTGNNNNTQTKKKGKKKKNTGATKKKTVVKAVPTEEASPVMNDVQPHVEFGNDRGTMTIKYSSAKHAVPLYTTAKSSHLDLAAIKTAFETEYETVKAMTTEQMTELRRDMQNTEFTELGAEALIHGLLSLIDDHDTKKLTLKMMLARGLLKVKA